MLHGLYAPVSKHYTRTLIEATILKAQIVNKQEMTNSVKNLISSTVSMRMISGDLYQQTIFIIIKYKLHI